LCRYTKVCTDTNSTTNCTVAECKVKCNDHTDFTCTAYAHSATGECYVFEDCVGEADEADYNLYVMTVGAYTGSLQSST